MAFRLGNLEARVRLGTISLLSCAAAACTIPAIDLEGRPCPCAAQQGYVCDPVTQTCVREADAGAAGGLDAGRGRDAGTRDAAGFDAAGVDAEEPPRDAGLEDPTACDDVLSGTLFCESFETAPAWDPGEDSGNGTVGLALAAGLPPGGAYRGVGALRATTTAGSGYGELITEFSPEGISAGPLYMRGYAYIPSGFTIVELNLLHVGFHRARYAEETLIGFNIFDGVSNPGTPFAGTFVGTGVGMQFQPELVEIPRDQWFCIRVEMLLDATDGSVRLFVDEQPAGAVTGVDTTPPNTGFHHFGVGIAYSDSTQANAELFLDEVAVSQTPLPCDLR